MFEKLFLIKIYNYLTSLFLLPLAPQIFSPFNPSYVVSFKLQPIFFGYYCFLSYYSAEICKYDQLSQFLLFVCKWFRGWWLFIAYLLIVGFYVSCHPSLNWRNIWFQFSKTCSYCCWLLLDTLETISSIFEKRSALLLLMEYSGHVHPVGLVSLSGVSSGFLYCFFLSGSSVQCWKWGVEASSNYMYFFPFRYFNAHFIHVGVLILLLLCIPKTQFL